LKRALLFLPLCLAACGGGASTPQDDAMEQAFTAGRLSLSQKDPAEAETQFQTAYRRAVARDDAAAIADAGYDIAAAQLARNHPSEALATVARTRAALALRGHMQPPALSLAEAGALHRLGQDNAAVPAALRAAQAKDADLAARATFLLGLVADAHGDTRALAAARDSVRGPAGKALPPARRADADELSARLDLHRADPAAAERDALDAAEGRRTLLDYRGMRTALTLAAEAARRGGDPSRAAAYDRQVAESLAAGT